MTDNKQIEKLINMLQSPNANTRYEACEYLRVESAITPEAIRALQNALKDSDPSVVDSAQSALAVHLPPESPREALSQQILPSANSSVFPNSLHQDVAPYPTPVPPMPSSSPNTPEYIFALEKRIMILEGEARRMSNALNLAITNSNNAVAKIPNSAIMSQSFLSRAFAVWGHFFVAQLIITIPISCIFFLIGMASNAP